MTEYKKPGFKPVCDVCDHIPEAAKGSRKQILANWKALLRVARAAKRRLEIADSCVIDAPLEGLETNWGELDFQAEMEERKALKEVEHLL